MVDADYGCSQTVAMSLKALARYWHVRSDHRNLLNDKTVTYKDWVEAHLTPMQSYNIVNCIVETTAILQFTNEEVDKILFPLIHKYPNEITNLKDMLNTAASHGNLYKWAEHKLISTLKSRRPLTKAFTHGSIYKVSAFLSNEEHRGTDEFNADAALNVTYRSCECGKQILWESLLQDKCVHCSKPVVSAFKKKWIEENELKELVQQAVNFERYKAKLTKKIQDRIRSLEVNDIYKMVTDKSSYGAKFDTFEEEIQHELKSSNIKSVYNSLKDEP